MEYIVINSFIDLQDGEHPYSIGDAYPREGRTVSDERIKELSGSNNKRKMPLIERVSKPEPKVITEEITEEKPKKRTPKEAKSDRSGSARNAKSKSGKAK